MVLSERDYLGVGMVTGKEEKRGEQFLSRRECSLSNSCWCFILFEFYQKSGKDQTKLLE